MAVGMVGIGWFRSVPQAECGKGRRYQVNNRFARIGKQSRTAGQEIGGQFAD